MKPHSLSVLLGVQMATVFSSLGANDTPGAFIHLTICIGLLIVIHKSKP